MEGLYGGGLKSTPMHKRKIDPTGGPVRSISPHGYSDLSFRVLSLALMPNSKRNAVDLSLEDAMTIY